VAVDDIVVLAKRLVALDAEATTVRNQMRRLLANGEGAPVVVRPTPRERSSAKGSRAAILAQAAEMDRRALDLLRDGPMTSGQIAKAMASKISTASERMRRLEQRGLIGRDDGGQWSSLSTS
jgi:DNA-binding Lrp family transcriptional regulator